MQSVAIDTMSAVINYIDEAFARDEDFSGMEEMIDAQALLSEDQKAAAWLYAWSCLGRARRRRMASHEFAGDPRV